MLFLSVFKAVERDAPPSQEEMERMGALIEESMRKGEIIDTRGCLPTALGARVRRAGTKVTVTDGPFTESKEVVAGYALMNAKSKEDAIEMAKRFLDVAGDGECELRVIYEGPEQLPDFADAAKQSVAKA